uniref:Uncharacterized LOC109511936 n=1 Tax=Hippocampus comes TaxID=109280 RepID=A0A3Q2YIJ3_HIPCM
MEDGMNSPVAVKVEGHSRSVILRYFRGDIGSMVDAHFSRALSKDGKDNMPVAKAKKMRKNIKLGKTDGARRGLWLQDRTSGQLDARWRL